MVCELVHATSDNHVGHFFVNYIKKNPDDICQIDAATGEQETRRSVLSRSIRLARSFRKFGLQPGDVIVLGGTNHLDLHIPFYAALMNGLPLAGVHPLFKYGEIKRLFKIVEPKIAFCQFEMYDDYCRAAQDLGQSVKIVTFGAGKCNLANFIETFGSSEPEDQFQVAQFDVKKVFCWLISTSGTTGSPKVAALSHSNVLQNMDFFTHSLTKNYKERRTAMNMSTIQWISAYYHAITLPINHIKLQTSAPASPEHVIELINKYKPIVTFTAATLFTPILRHEKHCDLTCFDVIKIGGSKIHLELLHALKARVRKDTEIIQGYGLSETGGVVFEPCPDGPIGNLGVQKREYEVKIVVDLDTENTITEPNVAGELLLRGPRMECYYNNPEATAEAFTEDGFLKTGDLIYRDENNYYFFVDRIKMLLKYKSFKIIPTEIESVILTHEAVEDACATGIPHPDYEELVVACVVRRPGAQVTAQEIKDHVASQLSEIKQLHGGVVFLNKLPTTASGKIARNEVREIVLTAKRE